MKGASQTWPLADGKARELEGEQESFGRAAPALSARAFSTALPPKSWHRRGSVDLTRPFIVAIGGGKGGIGKSLISANLAVLLGSRGHKVTLFDADLGGANAHTCLGLAAPKCSVADFLRRQVGELGEVATPTPFANLSLISGALDWLQAANPKPAEKARLGEALLSLPSDIVVIDLGAGTSLHTIDFFLLADRGIVALIPEPTSIENAYRFMKMACIRRLQALEMSWETRPLIARVLNDPDVRGLKSPAELLNSLRHFDPGLADGLARELKRRPFALIVNQIRTAEEEPLAGAIQQACRRYFGVEIDHVTSLPYADAAWQAVRRRRPLVTEDSGGPIHAGLLSVCQLVETALC